MTTEPSVECHLIEPLTMAEENILRLMAQGLSDKEIGLEVGLAPITVRGDHKQNIYDKLGLQPGFRNRKWAVHCARQLSLLPGPGMDQADHAPPGDNPYKGLDAFQLADAHLFFGRETFVERLLTHLSQNVSTPRFLAIVGPSGCGKSSAVRAGLIPALQKDGIPGASTWAMTTMFPHNNPFCELEMALRAIAVKHQPTLLELLERDPYGLVRVARLILPEDQPLFLVIDQFEEIFTLVEDSVLALRFMDLIYAAVTDPRSTVRVVITLRADFLDRPLMYPDFSWLVQEHTAMVVPLTPDELERTITLPAQQAHVTIESGLVARLVAEANEQPGALPLLEFALTELYDNRIGPTVTMDIYEDIGGLRGALAAQADKVYTDLNDAQQETARQIFLRLIALGEGTEDIRRRVPARELTSLVSQTKTMEYVIQFLAANRLLTLDLDPATKEPIVEVAHEALIREWGRLRVWLDESRTDVRMQRLLAAAANEWCQHEHEESYLMRGTKLAHFEGWHGTTDLALTAEERSFLESCITNETRRRTWRRRVWYIAVATSILVAVIMVVLALAERNQAHEAQNARATSEVSAAEAQELALVNGARAAFESGDLDTALALAVAANRAENPSAQAQLILSEAAYTPGTRLVFEQPHEFYALDVSPDGQTAISGTVNQQDALVYLFDLSTGETLHVLSGHTEIVYYVKFSPDGQTALTAGVGKTILWDVNTGTKIREFEQPAWQCAQQAAQRGIIWLEFHPDGERAYGSDFCGPIEWEVATGEVTRLFSAAEEFHPTSTEVSPDGKWLMTVSWDGIWILWDLEGGEVLHSFGLEGEAHTDWTTGCFRSNDGTITVVTGGVDGQLIEWDLETYEEIRRFDGDGDSLLTPACSSSGRYVLAGDNGPLHLWDMEAGEEIPLAENGEVVTDMRFPTFGKNEEVILYIAEPNQIRVRDMQYGAETRSVQLDLNLDESLNALLWAEISPDGRTALLQSVTRESEGDPWSHGPIGLTMNWGSFFVVDLATGQEITRLSPPVEQLESHLTSWLAPDERAILASLFSGQAVFHDTITGAQQILAGHRAHPSFSFSRDGRTALSKGFLDFDNQLIWWNLETGEILRRAIVSGVNDFQFTPDGFHALLAMEQGWVSLWDLVAEREIHRFDHHGVPVSLVRASPDGQMFVSLDAGGGVIQWDLSNRQKIRRFSDYGGDWVRTSWFGRDGRSFFVQSIGEFLQWDVATGNIIRNYPISEGLTSLTAPGPDGDSFYVMSIDLVISPNSASLPTFYQMRIDSAEELMVWTMENRYVRELTCVEREIYQLQPLCDADGVFPTSTPYVYATPAATSTISSVRPTVSPVPLPQVEVVSILPAKAGSQRGDVPAGDIQFWSYAGHAGETLTVRVNADQPCNLAAAEGCFDSWVTIHDPQGAVMTIVYAQGDVIDFGPSDDIEFGVQTDSLVEGLALPVDGTYQIEVSGAHYLTGGAYTLIIESQPAPIATSTPLPEP